MKRFLLGAVFGATATAAGFQVFGLNASTIAQRSAEHVPPAAVRADSATMKAPPQPHAGLASLGGTSPAVGAQQPVPPAEPAMPANTDSARHHGAAPLLPPVQLSREHAELLKPNPKEGRPLTMAELHMQFAAEPSDQAWSFAMEQTLRQHIAQLNQASEFEILNVECRTTLCELTAFGNQPGSDQRWASVLMAMGQQSWWTDFRGQSTTSSGVNGRTTIVTILQRARR